MRVTLKMVGIIPHQGIDNRLDNVAVGNNAHIALPGWEAWQRAKDSLSGIL